MLIACKVHCKRLHDLYLQTRYSLLIAGVRWFEVDRFDVLAAKERDLAAVGAQSVVGPFGNPYGGEQLAQTVSYLTSSDHCFTT